MPDPGRARHDSYRIEAPKERLEHPALPWTCAGITMLNVYFEVLKDPLLDRLPSEYCRTSPPYCRLMVIDHPETPVGSFREATLALGCRLNMMPAGFAAVSLTENPRALAAGIMERGFPNAIGTIEFEYDLTHAHALIGDSGGALLEVTLPLLQTIEPSRLAFDHIDCLKTTAEGNTELMICKPDLKIERAAICKNARIEYPTERPDSAWQALQCRNLVSAQLVHGIRTFDAARPPG